MPETKLNGRMVIAVDQGEGNSRCRWYFTNTVSAGLLTMTLLLMRVAYQENHYGMWTPTEVIDSPDELEMLEIPAQVIEEASRLDRIRGKRWRREGDAALARMGPLRKVA